MGPIKIQDVQNAVNLAQTRIVQQMPPKQDVQLMGNNVKTLLAFAQQNQQLLQQNQQFLRQAEYQRLQLIRRVAALEARTAQLEQEVKWTRANVEKVSNRQPQTIVLSNQDGDGQYVYQP